MIRQIEIYVPLAIGPIERGDRFEDSICDYLDDHHGQLLGSGSFGNSDGISGFQISLELPEVAALNGIVEILRLSGAPDDSTIRVLPDGEARRLVSFC